MCLGKSSCSQTTNGGSSGREVPDGRWRETKIMAKIGFIGMGNIGYAIMRSLLNKYKTEDNTFTDLNRRRVAQIEKETGVKAVDTNQDCAENAKYIVLAIKPQFYDNVLADIKDHVTKENIIISIAPGITIDSVNEKLGGDRRIVRAMPNTPALIGEGMTGVCQRLDEHIDVCRCTGTDTYNRIHHIFRNDLHHTKRFKEIADHLLFCLFKQLLVVADTCHTLADQRRRVRHAARCGLPDGGAGRCRQCEDGTRDRQASGRTQR